MREPTNIPSTDEILAARGPKNSLNIWEPVTTFLEKELNAKGKLEDVATLFLTNRECPFRCLMCDLWKNTLSETVPAGAIPVQIKSGLQQFPNAQSIKLYNSGNFFDPNAIPIEDYPQIAGLLNFCQTVIVENHPRLRIETAVEFQSLLQSDLEVALGLETVHEDILKTLNKQMTVADYDHATRFLIDSGIHVRTFLLIRPPFMTEQEGVDWAIRSLKHAFELGSRVCSLIPTRTGNGMMELLQQREEFASPSLKSIEQVFETGLRMKSGRVFLDTWDLERFSACPQCTPSRQQRLKQMNLTQQVPAPITCECE